jgi:hypothetical protein
MKTTAQATDQLPDQPTEFADGDVVLVARRAVFMRDGALIELDVGRQLVVGTPTFALAMAAGVEVRPAASPDEQKAIEGSRRRDAAALADDRRARAAMPSAPKLAPIEVPDLAAAAEILDADPAALRGALALLDAEETRCRATIPHQSYYPTYLGGRAAASRSPAEALVAVLDCASQLRGVWSRGRIAADLAIEEARRSAVAPPPPAFNAAQLLGSLPAGSLQLVDGRLAVRGVLHPQVMQQIEAHREEIKAALADFHFID